MKTLPNIHPGEVLLEEFLLPMGISQNALARAAEVPPRRINEIVLGKRGISAFIVPTDAPGYQVAETKADGRVTRQFRTEAPIHHYFSIQSARYEVRRDTLGDIELAVYFHPGHDHNVDRMLKALALGP